MKEISAMLSPPIFDPIPSATSSPVSAGGAVPSVSPEFQTIIDRFGQAAVLASLSPRRALKVGLLTSGTCGRTGFISSSSASLQSFLASRLQARLPLPGLTLFRLTWKERVTPWQRPICALRASALRTSGSAFGSWPTPDHNSTGAGPQGREGGL